MLKRKAPAAPAAPVKKVPMEDKNLTTDLVQKFTYTAHCLLKKDQAVDELENLIRHALPFKPGDVISKLPIPNGQTEFGSKVVNVSIDRHLITYTEKPADRVFMICPIILTLQMMKDANTPKDSTWVAPLVIESDGTLFYHSHKYVPTILKKGK